MPRPQAAVAADLDLVPDRAPDRAVAAREFRMPEVGLGDGVLWSHGPGTDPAPGLVTRVGRRSISLIVFPPDSPRGLVMDGVRHHLDPELAKVQSDAGVWRPGRSMYLLEVLADAIQTLTGLAPGE